MKENPESDPRLKQHPSAWKQSALPAVILAIMQACLTISGMGIEGFVLWIIILFVAYWLIFTILVLLWRRFTTRS